MPSSRRGFILPTTLMVVTLLTVMLTAGFILVSAEFRTTDNALAMTRAQAFAQAGLERYWSMNHNLNVNSNTTRCSSGSDSVRIQYSGGYADVVACQLVDTLNNAGDGLWLVRSTGTLTGSVLEGQTAGKRVVAQLARFNAPSLPMYAAITAVNQIFVNHGKNVNGHQSGCGSGSDVHAVAAWSSDTLAIPIQRNQLQGTAPAQQGLSSRQAAYDSTHIDWSSILAGRFNADYTAASWVSGYHSYYITGDVSLSGTGSGLLVVTGNLSLQDNSNWNGAILAGGWVRTVGLLQNYKVTGAIVSGLNNTAAPGSVGPDTLGGAGGSNIVWSSCNVATATAAMGTMKPLRNSWIPNWSTY